MNTIRGRSLFIRSLTALALIATAGAPAGAARPIDCRIELDREVLPARRANLVVIKVTLDPAAAADRRRAPVNLAVVLDRSGSMRGTKLAKAKEAAIMAVRRLGPGDLFSLVVYNRRATTIVPAQDAASRDRIEARIQAIEADGGTALFSGVCQGAAEIRKNLHRAEYVHRIILLSDGLANVGPAAPEDLGRIGAGLLKEQISVTTVGVGMDYNEDLMTGLARNSDGNTYFAETSRDLPPVFAAELGSLLNIVARRIVLEIECQDGIRPVRIIGREGTVRGNLAEFRLNQLYGGRQKHAFLEVRVPASEPETARPIAEARCRYEDTLSRTPESVTSAVQARFSVDETVVLVNANRDVQNYAAANGLATVRDQAVDLMDEGKTAAAVRLLLENSQRLREIGTRFGNRLVVEQGKLLEEEARKLQEQGMDKRLRKQIRTQNFQQRQTQDQAPLPLAELERRGEPDAAGSQPDDAGN